MKRKVILIQEKRIRIESPAWSFNSMGGGGDIPGHLYYDEPWVSDEHSQDLLALANKAYEKLSSSNAWIKKPELSTFWNTIERIEETI